MTEAVENNAANLSAVSKHRGDALGVLEDVVPVLIRGQDVRERSPSACHHDEAGPGAREGLSDRSPDTGTAPVTPSVQREEFG
jgi:hypothetical protein